MSHRAATALARTLRGHVVVGMIGARTVNLGHIASTGAREVLIASTYRRLQRFFQHVDLGSDWAAPILARLIGVTGPGRSRSTGPTGRSGRAT